MIGPWTSIYEGQPKESQKHYLCILNKKSFDPVIGWHCGWNTWRDYHNDSPISVLLWAEMPKLPTEQEIKEDMKKIPGINYQDTEAPKKVRCRKCNSITVLGEKCKTCLLHEMEK